MWRGEAVRDAGGSVVGLRGTVQDLTELKRAEESLQRSQALLAVAGRVSRMGAWAAEVPAETVVWSDELRAIYELSPDRTPGVQEGLRFYAPEDREAVRAAFTACAARGVPFDLEARFDTATGRRRWARVIGEAVRDGRGAVVRVQGAFQDITDRKAADEALRLRDRAIQAVAQGIVIADANRADCPVTYASPGYERLTGYTEAEALGRNCRMLQGKDTDRR